MDNEAGINNLGRNLSTLWAHFEQGDAHHWKLDKAGGLEKKTGWSSLTAHLKNLGKYVTFGLYQPSDRSAVDLKNKIISRAFKDLQNCSVVFKAKKYSLTGQKAGELQSKVEGAANSIFDPHKKQGFRYRMIGLELALGKAIEAFDNFKMHFSKTLKLDTSDKIEQVAQELSVDKAIVAYTKKFDSQAALSTNDKEQLSDIFNHFIQPIVDAQVAVEVELGKAREVIKDKPTTAYPEIETPTKGSNLVSSKLSDETPAISRGALSPSTPLVEIDKAYWSEELFKVEKESKEKKTKKELVNDLLDEGFDLPSSDSSEPDGI